ncbi:MAG: hypothetical protein AVDCRST_MAG35-2697 [uncultured Quadrisphaera sp.]|uniref:Uncharacterized protein n=1 Tax=uncultured Quadrisphaera sp. TaxID=904978 RepID=A0A6J4Q3T2_9ACTN|nr:MAG: hypothetical protein AVDCRST_MAG35-2697 [uncultured Quadrisphaera sp.]
MHRTHGDGAPAEAGGPGRAPWSVATLDVPRWVLAVPAVVSLLVLVLAGLATYEDPGRRWASLAVAGRAEALPGWWATVLYVLVALACFLRARADGLGGGGRLGPRAARAGAVAWALLGALLSLVSADHVLGLHHLVAGDERLSALPGPVAAHPVQVALLAAGVPVVLLLLLVLRPRQRLLVVAAGGLYLVSGLLLDQRLVQPSWNHVRLETAELAFEWAGALVLLLAASAHGQAAPAPGAAVTRSRGTAGSRPR